MTSLIRQPVFWICLAAILLCLFATHPAYAASSSGGSGLPWEGPLATLSNSMKGPVAFVIALLGILACGATLIWGGEVSTFAQRMVYVVLVVCILVFANNLLTGALFSGALIPAYGLPLNAAAALTPIA